MVIRLMPNSNLCLNLLGKEIARRCPWIQMLNLEVLNLHQALIFWFVNICFYEFDNFTWYNCSYNIAARIAVRRKQFWNFRCRAYCCFEWGDKVIFYTRRGKISIASLNDDKPTRSYSCQISSTLQQREASSAKASSQDEKTSRACCR